MLEKYSWWLPSPITMLQYIKAGIGQLSHFWKILKKKYLLIEDLSYVSKIMRGIQIGWYVGVWVEGMKKIKQYCQTPVQSLGTRS